MTMTAQLPLVCRIGGHGTDDPELPSFYGLPAESVTATEETTREEETTLSGYALTLTPQTITRALTVRVDVPDAYPLPRVLGEAWARLRPGGVVNVSETHTDRSTTTFYTNAEVISNTLRVTRQLSLTEAYYSGAIELRVLIEEPV